MADRNITYSFKAHPTKYRGVQFRSRLEARWACFFDLIGWRWEYEPIDLEEWCPDFRVEFPCGHSECGCSHVLLVEVKPYYSIEEFNGHPCKKYLYGVWQKANGEVREIPADASAVFGVNPSVTEWLMCHGAGAGYYTIEDWVDGDVNAMWNQAGNTVQWKPSSRNYRTLYGGGRNA